MRFIVEHAIKIDVTPVMGIGMDILADDHGEQNSVFLCACPLRVCKASHLPIMRLPVFLAPDLFILGPLIFFTNAFARYSQ